MQKKLIVLLTVFLCLFPLTSWGGYFDHKLKWNTVKTDHFNIHFHNDTEIVAKRVAEICEKLGIKYEEVKKMVVADKRILDGHLDITTLKGFGGKCFPKDLLALRAMARGKGVDTKILDAVWAKNLKVRKSKDWEEIPFAVSPAFGNKS